MVRDAAGLRTRIAVQQRVVVATSLDDPSFGPAVRRLSVMANEFAAATSAVARIRYRHALWESNGY